MKAVGLGRGEHLLAGGARFERSPGWLARLLAPGFHKILDRIDEGLETGSILGHLPDGTTRLLGGRSPGFEAEVTLHDWRALMRLATNRSIGWFQGWEAGEWEAVDLVPLFALFMANGDTLGDTGRARGPWRLAARLVHWLNRNTPSGAQRNIHAHYDLGNDFYDQWLDPTMLYSCALFGGERTGPDMVGQFFSELSDAQSSKAAAILDRVDHDGVERILEIGCGWGTLAGFMAERYEAHVDAISLSEEQLAYAPERWDLAIGSVDFRKQDYRDVSGQFDAIVSVEMVEALGREYWPDFMDCIARNLKPGGRAAIQFISMKESLFDAYAGSADFIQAYIFPGGLLIRNSEFRALAEERGLRWTDQTDFGQHYAETLRLWRHNFVQAVEDERLPDGFDERFVRLWRYYLQYCEGGFRGGGIDVHQVTLIKEG